MSAFAQLRMLMLMAGRSLAAHRVKSAIVGAILMFGTFLVVTGGALLDSMESAMARSITSSLSGHLQVYSDDAEDELALFGGFGMGSTDIGEIEDFSTVQASLSQVDNVRAVVPMGITIATVFGGNDIDRALQDLRDAVREGDPEAIALVSGRVRQIAGDMARSTEADAELAADPGKLAQDREALARARSDAFWQEFEQDPASALEFLERRIAPLAQDGRLFYLRLIGTDLERFTESFDRFYVVKGEPIPAGRRGLLISERTHERLLKNLVARELDEIHEELQAGATIADDTLLRDRVTRNSRQYQRILYYLDAEEAKRLEPKLRAIVPGAQGDLPELVQAFLRVDDANFEQRYRFFYDEIAPLVDLYEVEVGDVLTLRAYTKSGYIKAVNVRIYGTYDFEGLEDSDLASASNLTDLVTWRELYGKMSSDQRAELAAIKAEVGVEDLSRDSVEDALFGAGGDLVEEVAPSRSGFDEFAEIEVLGGAERQELLDTKTYDREQFEKGLALNAAIVLDDPSRLEETQRAVESRIAADGLGLRVVDWQQASGILGQFVVVMRALLYTAIFVIFLVALVIINNAMVMATLERTAEIGTMRAIGARRGFVMALFLVETLVLGLVAGVFGALAAVGFVGWLGQVGIPAPADVLVILFAGPRLYPAVTAGNLLFGIVVIVLVSLLSTLYPALVAARVPPVVAIQGKE